MHAFVLQGKSFVYKEVEEPVVSQNQVKIKLKYAGLNHRDLKLPNRRNEADPALVIGSDGAGIIVEVGEGVREFTIGDEVIVNPGLGWKEKSDAPPEGFEILGLPDNGTFAGKIVVSEDHVEKKPAHLDWKEAGVVALSALTGYRAIFSKGQVKSGDTVFIPGAGSGVATYLIQFAKAADARVIVTSRSEQKRAKAIQLGADLAIDTSADWPEILQNEQIDIVIESVGKATFNRSLEVLKRGGKLVTFGATTEDDVTINIRKFFYGQYQLLGTTMGSREELRDMLRFIETKDIKPVVDQVFDLKDTQEAFDYLQAGKQFGKVALKIG
ncbi:zinc-binding dehydrogenase [Aquibacillus sp. 3ASR75-11]|uniref:Zinc-binding dehydrogenase n=1 Tax=Terrihalobacillus insolitus TaxID=2950438 RepID=A0A9X3WR66_9BACI|nr:zinc-binding dehydrogenase [Terrihalobacillus insolitus]MDC3412728.1 zinc-binding dehydrogenase [Terrihalobacillus insolitus]MDC3423795.1 zinc-binding dehydrogenase [Terrihalobacillus insolitus]